MNPRSRQQSLGLSILGAFTALLLTSAFAHGQAYYRLEWNERFNNSATSSDTQDNWVANSYTASAASGANIVSVSLPIGDTFTDKPITALIYKGADLMDPTAGGGLMLLGRKDTTFSSTAGAGTIVTVTFDTPIALNDGDVFYAAVLIPQVPADHFPFRSDTRVTSGRSFFDTGLTFGGAYDVNQLPDNSANITPLGGTHPVVGPGIQDAANLALWANGVP